MTDSPNPNEPQPRRDKEYEDPHYHDEDPEIQHDDAPREGRTAGKRKPGHPRRIPRPRRRFHED